MELLVAISIISIGLFGVWNLFLSNFSGEQEAKARIIGSNLAREGIEAVKNMRDSNWLRVSVNDDTCGENGDELCRWDYGFEGDGTAIVRNVLNQDYVTLDYLPVDIDSQEVKLFLDSNGFYSHDQSGLYSGYNRLIIIRDVCCSDSDLNLKCDTAGAFNIKNIAERCTTGELKVGMDVQSIVVWEINGRRREVTAEDQLFNWR